MQSEEIRKMFLDFFQSKQHKILPSFSIIRNNDPSLMFTNSGMNYFKNIFIGNQVAKYSRIANCQKCLRVSGKHNDLNEVGYDNYHHTMFEMLGNWSFADYFKEEAIFWAWKLLVDVYMIPKENIYVTVFNGDEKSKLSKDVESFKIWNNFVHKKNIIFASKKYNFWEMGNVGPCGISTEIHIDLRDELSKNKIQAIELINQGHPDVIEIWNIVFINCYRDVNGNLTKLPNFYVDTGIGFERLCRVIQKKSSNYDTDLFIPIINKIEELVHTDYGSNIDNDITIRVIADHVRAMIFAISDGQQPANTGPGYVLRRIIRRAMSYAYRYLDIKDPFLYKLVYTVVKKMGYVYTDLLTNILLVENIIKNEEKLFLKTLYKGIKKINIMINTAIQNGCNIITGDDLFKLYDTYGFPIDIAYIFAKEHNLLIDEHGFTKRMNHHKMQSNNIKK